MPPSAPGIPGTKLPPAARETTRIGMPAPPSETRPAPSNPPPAEQRPKLDSIEISAESLLGELAAKNAENAALVARLAAAERAPLLPTDAPNRGQWHKLLYQLGGALVAILVPCGAYLAYRVETLVPRVDSAETRAGVAKTKADTGRDLLRETIVFLAAWQEHQDCLNSQFASVGVRGTGHKITGVPDGDVLWGEQNRPPNRPAALWPTWTWFTIRDCGPEPHVPTLPL